MASRLVGAREQRRLFSDEELDAICARVGESRVGVVRDFLTNFNRIYHVGDDVLANDMMKLFITRKVGYEGASLPGHHRAKVKEMTRFAPYGIGLYKGLYPNDA